MKTYLFLLFWLIVSSVYSQSGNVSGDELDKQIDALLLKIDSLEEIHSIGNDRLVAIPEEYREIKMRQKIGKLSKRRAKRQKEDLIQELKSLDKHFIALCKEIVEISIKYCDLEIKRFEYYKKIAQENQDFDIVEEINTQIADLKKTKQTSNPEDCQPK